VGVLRVDEVCVVGVAGVELGVVDRREDLQAPRRWPVRSGDLAFAQRAVQMEGEALRHAFRGATR